MVRDPVSGKARLSEDKKTLTIARPLKSGKVLVTTYALEILDPHPELGCPAFRLTKANGARYDVILTDHGPQCDCEDFNRCRVNAAKPCKHCCALQAVGLLRNDH